MKWQFLWFNWFSGTYGKGPALDQLREFSVSCKFVDDGLDGHQTGDCVAFFAGDAHQPGNGNEDFPHDELQRNIFSPFNSLFSIQLIGLVAFEYIKISMLPVFMALKMADLRAVCNVTSPNVTHIIFQQYNIHVDEYFTFLMCTFEVNWIINNYFIWKSKIVALDCSFCIAQD